MSDYAVKAEVLGNIQFNAGTTEPIVSFNHDGTITVANPDKIDETAQKFLDAVGHLMQNGFVVRRKGVSEFMEVAYGDIEWTHDPERATRFARLKDAELAASMNFEAVPFSQAMVF